MGRVVWIAVRCFIKKDFQIDQCFFPDTLGSENLLARLVTGRVDLVRLLDVDTAQLNVVRWYVVEHH